MSRFDLSSRENVRTVLAASTGGHLSQLVRLTDTFEFVSDPLWITFDSPQSRSLLRGQRAVFVPYIAPRGYKEAFNALPMVRSALRAEEFDLAISTGAALAAVVLPQAVLMGKKSIYIESVSRFLGPSMTGKVMRLTPGVETFTQHAAWSSKGWQLGPSVLNEFESARVETGNQSVPIKIFVTLGTIKPYRFDSLINRINSVSTEDCEIVWQLGESHSASVTRGKKFETMSAFDFDQMIDWADVVVSHAGVGSAMRIMELGKAPILVPRRSARNEHVDDHQMQIATVLSDRGLAMLVDSEELTMSHIVESMERCVISRSEVRHDPNETGLK